MPKEGSDNQVTLKIPRPLYEALKQVIEGSGFHSVTEFAVYVLRDLVSHRKGVTDKAPEADVEALKPDEIEAIRKRLESLGYL
ncbi:MAG TPA: CopG family transcriptional regulator [Actinomycetota bacterium]|nr:CopG family transcriptional regulator [Actinomycetota bacterium]